MGMLIAARAQGERVVAQAKQSVAKWLYKIILNPSPAQIEVCSAEKNAACIPRPILNRNTDVK